jgi:hypothetical protein
MQAAYPDLYKSVELLDAAHGGRRIYSPVSYSPVRERQLVPIVHIEAMALAAWFPICWHADKDSHTLVAIRSLDADGGSQPPGSPETLTSLPLILRAYPFAVLEPATAGPTDSHFIEDATADRPTDIGAPIFLPDGRPGRGAQLRLRAAGAFRDARRLTDEMTDALVKASLLEPWPLDFKIGDGQLRVDNMTIVRQSAFGQPPIQQFLRQFGSTGALLLGAHRISLFRAGALVQAAQQRAAARPMPATT